MAIGAAVGQHARGGSRAAVEQRDSLTLDWPNGVHAADGANFGLHLTSLRCSVAEGCDRGHSREQNSSAKRSMSPIDTEDRRSAEPCLKVNQLIPATLEQNPASMCAEKGIFGP